MAESAAAPAPATAGGTVAADHAPGASSWRATRAAMRADRDRLRALARGEGKVLAAGTFNPSYLAAALYRVSRYLHLRGRTVLARFTGHLNRFLTGADISPGSDLGKGLVVVNPPGTSLYGTAGRNLTVMASAGIGGGHLGRDEDVGGGSSMPVLGDDVVLEPHCGVLGPCRIGHRVRVGAGACVTQDVPDDCDVEAPRSRVLTRSAET